MITPNPHNHPNPPAQPSRGRNATRPAPPRATQQRPQSDKHNDGLDHPSQAPARAPQPRPQSDQHNDGLDHPSQSPPAPQPPPNPAQPRRRRPILALSTTLLTLTLIALTACASQPSSIGQYYQGRTLHLSIASLDRANELRYSTIDPTGVIRRWSLQPNQPGHQLILARLKVENHTAVSAIVNIDRAAAELRDFTNATYHPITIDQQVRRDYRQDPQPLIRIDQGQCFDYHRALINPGTTIQWQNESDNPQQLTFPDNPAILDNPAIAPNGQAQLPPQATLSHTYTQPGSHPYTCSLPNGPQQNAEIQVTAPTPNNQPPPDIIERTVQFLQGSFRLPQGNGIDGYLIFETPIGTQFRDLRWRAGDSITIRF